MNNATDLVKTALECGFDDARTLKNSALICFKKYTPCITRQKGFAHLSEYYVASNTAYHAAQELAAQTGGKLDSHLSQRLLASNVCGGIRKNGFYYHPKFGSCVCIQTILYGEVGELSPVYLDCRACTKCIDACPTNGVLNIENCMRKYMDGPIPEKFHPHIYQLLGCELCQAMCPYNKCGTANHSFEIHALLNKQGFKEISGLAGKNMARTMRLMRQAEILSKTDE